MIGVGSPHGDDAVGWAVAEQLAAGPWPPDVEVLRGAPLDCLDALQPDRAVVLVDATRCGLAPGRVHRPSPEALREARGVSSHGLGVPEIVALARALGRLPQRLAVVGVEAGILEGPRLSPAVAASVQDAAREVRALVDAWHGRAPLEASRA